jgi:hypothetical protein
MSAATVTDNPDWRLFQVFMHPDARGIFHVEIDFSKTPDLETGEFRCNCPVFLKSTECKHVSHVIGGIHRTPGAVVLIPLRTDSITDEDLQTAITAGGKDYHEFVLRHGVIEIL